MYRPLVNSTQSAHVSREARVPLPNTTQNPAVTDPVTAVARNIIENVLEVPTDQVRFKYTSLHDAAESGDLLAIKVLIRDGKDIEGGNPRKWTPLYLATLQGHVAAMRLLIQYGAKINTRTVSVRMTAQLKKYDHINFAISGKTPLYAAAFGGHVESAKLLIEAGANLEIADENGCTPLYVAVEEGHTAVVELLINAGANIEAANTYGNMPLHEAVWEEQTTVIEILLQAGANINTCDAFGKTPLCLAAALNRPKAAKMLIEARANLEIADENGYTPLTRAVKYGQMAVLELLINAGANLEAADIDGSTPLHEAVLGEHTTAIERLLQAGANINACDARGWTPLYLAAICDRPQVAKMLVEAGADLLTGGDDNTLKLAIRGKLDVILLPFLDQQEQSITMMLQWLREPLLGGQLKSIVEGICRQLTLHQAFQYSVYKSLYRKKTSSLPALLSSRKIIQSLTTLQSIFSATLDHQTNREEIEASLKEIHQYAKDLRQIRTLVHELLKELEEKRDDQSVASTFRALTRRSKQLLALIKHYEELELRCSSKNEHSIPPDEAFDEAEVFGLLTFYGLGVAVDDKNAGVEVTPEDSYINLVGAGAESIMEAGLETGRDLRRIGITLETSRSEALDILRRFLEEANVQRIKAMLNAEGKTCISCLDDFSTSLIAN